MWRYGKEFHDKRTVIFGSISILNAKVYMGSSTLFSNDKEEEVSEVSFNRMHHLRPKMPVQSNSLDSSLSSSQSSALLQPLK